MYRRRLKVNANKSKVIVDIGDIGGSVGGGSRGGDAIGACVRILAIFFCMNHVNMMQSAVGGWRQRGKLQVILCPW